MRKLSAMILLFPVAVLFIGAVRVGSVCAVQQPAAQCMKMATCDGCGDGCGACHKSKDQPQRSHQPQQSQQPQQKTDCSCCLECPLCTPVTFNPEYRLDVLRIQKTTEYAVMPDNPLSDYSRQHWKPPNHAPLI